MERLFDKSKRSREYFEKIMNYFIGRIENKKIKSLVKYIERINEKK